MTKLRLEITKGEAVRYISHLDYSRSVERALRRAKLPVAYSEGFNPHMKMAFASALSVGVTSDSEYLDVDLASEIPLADFSSALAAKLPEGIALKRVKVISTKCPALMAVINLAIYRIYVPLPDAEVFAVVQECVRRFNQAEQVLYVKESPKGKREIDVKKYLMRDVEVAAVSGGLELDLSIWITPTGSVKPSAVLAVLVDQFALPAVQEAALINRCGLHVYKDSKQLSPLDSETV